MKKLTSNQKNRKFLSLLSRITLCVNIVLTTKICNKANHKGFNLKTKLFADDAVLIDKMLKKTTKGKLSLKIQTVADAMVVIARLSEIVSNDLILKPTIKV